MERPLVVLFFIGSIGSLTGCDAKSEVAPATPVTKSAGDSCRVATECSQGFACADRVCVRAPRRYNESCGLHASCVEELICHRSAITERKTWEDPDYGPSDTYGDRCRSPEEVATEKERDLLEQSGLNEDEIANKVAAVAEQPKAAPGPGLRVRVARTESTIRTERGTVFAGCRDSERLISGSCEISQADNSIQGHRDDPEVGVAGHSETDTVGARWVCVGGLNDRVIVKALCQTLEPVRSSVDE